MKIKAEISYNLDILCFVNTMTADDYFVDKHKEAFVKFFPLISDETKRNIQDMVKTLGSSMLSPRLTLHISSLTDFNSRHLIEMLRSHAEMEASLNLTPYKYSREDFDTYFSFLESAIIPLISELEAAGFYLFWKEERLPLIEKKCGEIEQYLVRYDAEQIMRRYKGDIDSSDFTVYLCSFTHPLGIKLCGNNLISDSKYKNDTILSNVTHEAFHPPYNNEAVKPYLDKIAQMPLVLTAFENQSPNSGYDTMDGFIEENIVEALGIYVLVKLGVDMNTDEYFKTHDDGSHVISPFFYKYLCEAPKDARESFEDYFIKFANDFITIE